MDRAVELQRLEEAIEKLDEGDISELTEEDLELLDQEDVNLHQFDENDSPEKEVGNVLTDRYLWRRNPEKAQNIGNEDILERIRLSREGRRSRRPSKRKRKIIFRDLVRSEDFHAAAKYAETAEIDAEEEIEEAALSLVERGEKKKAFAALDAFDYEKTTSELLEDGHTNFYLATSGPEKLIDKVATDIWQDLDGSARAFFQMYIDDTEERPENSFGDETTAEIYHPAHNEKRESLYREDAFQAYEQVLEQDEQEAEQILERFDIEIPKY